MSTILPPETNLHDRYVITRKLGQGGMGAVYLAHDRVLDLKVAIKENFDTSPSAQKQFELEARILASLRHPNLPRVTDYFIDNNGRQYLVMDYVQGQDLEKIVADRGPVPERHALEWMDQVFDAVQYLHSQQPEPVIHRDIKPSNLKQGSDGRIILVDFGIAKHLQPLQGTVTGARAVSPGFSPPEQYSRDVRTDQRSDIYALGATMYFLLSGTPPPESVLRQGGVRLGSLQERDETITDRTNAVVMKMLQLDPDERYQTVNEVRRIFSTTHPLSAPESILDKSKPETTDRRATPRLSEPGTPTSQITLSRLPQPMRALQIPLKTTLENAIDQVFDVTRRGLVDEIVNDIIGEARSIEGNTILLFGCSGCGTSKIATEIIRVVESKGGPNHIAAAISLVNDKYLDHPIEMWNDVVSGLGWQATHRVADDLKHGIRKIYDIINPKEEKFQTKDRKRKGDWRIWFGLLKIVISGFELKVGPSIDKGGSTEENQEPSVPQDKESIIHRKLAELANYINKKQGKMVLILNKVKHPDLLNRLWHLAAQPGAVIVTILDEEVFQAWQKERPELVQHFSSKRKPKYVPCLHKLEEQFCNRLLDTRKVIDTPEYLLFSQYFRYASREQPKKAVDILKSLHRKSGSSKYGMLVIELDRLKEWRKYCHLETILQTDGWIRWFPTNSDSRQSALEEEDFKPYRRDAIRLGLYKLLDYLIEESQSQGELTTEQITEYAIKNCNLGFPASRTTELVKIIMRTLEDSRRVSYAQTGWDLSRMSRSV